jgi:urea carboxylase-associated protein 1
MSSTDVFQSTGEQILEDLILAPGQPWGRVLRSGERVRIIDLEGKQAVDFLCYDHAKPSDRYNAANTLKMHSSIFLTKGTSLWSDDGHKLMTIVADTCGFHDTIAGCCSGEMNMIRYGKPGPGNCRDTLEAGLRPFGLTRADVVANINWFMFVPVRADGAVEIAEGVSKPGDYVELVAEREVICVASNCTQLYNQANNFKPTPVRIVVTAAE